MQKICAMKIYRCKAIFTRLLMLLIPMLAMVTATQARIVPVSSMTGLQNAVDVAFATDTIMLASGDYTLSSAINVRRTCTIMGADNRTSIKTVGKIRHFSVSVRMVRMARLTLVGVGADVDGAGNITILNNPVTAANENLGGGVIVGALDADSSTVGFAMDSMRIAGCRRPDQSDGGGGFYVATRNVTARVTNSEFISCQSVLYYSGVPYFGWGGGMYVLGRLELENVQVRNCLAQEGSGGMHAAGALSMRNVEFTGNESKRSSGAVFVAGRLSITGSNLFENNKSAGPGGAINASGASVTIEPGSVFRGNSAITSETYNSGFGAAISHSSVVGSMSISGCEFYNNIGNGYFNGTDWSGGAVSARGNLVLEDVVFEDNVGLNGGAVFKDYAGTFTMRGTNRFARNRSTSRGGAIYTNADLTLDASTTFERHKSNGNGGVFYVGNNATLTLNNMTFVGDTAVSGGVIAFGSTNGNIALTNITIDSAVATGVGGTYGSTFNGGGAISANGVGDVTINNCTITSCSAPNARAGNGGGAIFSADNVIVSVVNSKLNANSSNQEGGAIKATGPLSISNSEIKKNTAGGAGGAIHSNSTLTLNTVVMDSNKAVGNGGAIYRTTTVNDFLISGNNSFSYNTAAAGGAIYTGKATVIAAGSRIVANASTGAGGAIYCSAVTGTMSISDIRLVNNTAGSNGGAIVSACSLALHNVVMEDNLAYASGGAVYTLQLASGLLTVDGTSRFVNNKAQHNNNTAVVSTKVGGGAIYTQMETSISGSSTFIGNRAYAGGAIYAVDLPARLNIQNAVFKRDTSFGAIASYGGGGAIITYSAAKLSAVTIDSCITPYAGGAIICRAVSAPISIDNSIISNNIGNLGGGAIHIYNGSPLSIRSTRLIGNRSNSAGMGGGAISMPVNASVARNLKLIASELRDNSSASTGGAVHVLGNNATDTMLVESCVFANNTTAISGGAIDCRIAGYNAMRYSSIADNKVLTQANGSNGGGVYFYSNVRRMLLEKNTFSGNKAYNGGGLYVASASAVATLVHNTFANDTATTATNPAGGAYLAGTTVAVLNTFGGNYPSAIYSPTANNLTLHGSIVSGNTGSTLTGAVINASSSYNAIGYADSVMFDSLDAQGNAKPTYSGGQTKTLMIKRGSPAQNTITQAKVPTPQAILAQWTNLINSNGYSVNLSYEQRDSARLQGPHVDKGAVERRPVLPFPKAILRHDTICRGATIDLRTLIAQVSSVRDTFFFRNSLYTDTIKKPQAYPTSVTTLSTVYIRFVSPENVLLDTFATFTMHPEATLVVSPRSVAICENGSANLTAACRVGNDTLKFYKDAQLTLPIPISVARAAKEAGTYYMQTTTLYGCQSRVDSILLQVDSLPKVHIKEKGQTLEVCHNAAIGLQGDTIGASSVAWGHNGKGFMTSTTGINSSYDPALIDANKSIKVWLTARGFKACSSMSRGDTVSVFVLPRPTQIAAPIIEAQPLNPLPMYGDTIYRLKVSSVGQGAISNIHIVAEQPDNQDFKIKADSNFFYNPYANATRYTTPPVQHVLRDLLWKIEATNDGANKHDTLPGGQSMAFECTVYNDTCGFISGSYLNFMVLAQDVCGVIVASPVVKANPLEIIGFPDTFNAYDLRAATSAGVVNPCINDTLTLTLSAIKTNEGKSDSTIEHFSVLLPIDVDVVVGSYTNIYQGPSRDDLSVSVLPSGVKELRLPMTNGIEKGDSVKIAFKVLLGNAACGNQNITFSMLHDYTAVNYASDGVTPIDSCITSQILSTKNIPVEVVRFQLRLGNSISYDYRSGWSGVVSAYNEGLEIPAGQIVTVSLYVDSANNSLLNIPADTLIAKKEVTLTSAWASGDSLKFDFANVKISPDKQLVATATITPSCQCSVEPLTIALVGGVDTVCQHTEQVFQTAKGMTSYDWQAFGGAIVRGGLPTDSVAFVRWDSAGVGVVTVSFTSKLGERSQILRDSVAVIAAPLTDIALKDSVATCKGTAYNLANAYTGSDSLCMYSDRDMQNLLTGNALQVTTPGWYYAKVVSARGCTSLPDSVLLQQDSLPRVLISNPDTVENCYNSLLPLRATTSFSAYMSWTHNGNGNIVNPNSTTSAYYTYSGATVVDSGKFVKIMATAHGAGTCATTAVSDSLMLFVLPRPAALNIGIVTQPLMPQDICADTIYELLLITTKGDSLQRIKVEMHEQGSRFNVVYDSSFVEVPYRSGTWTRLGNPVYSSGVYTWSLSTRTWLPLSDTIRMRTRVASQGCGFTSASYVVFKANAQNGCGNSVLSNDAQALPFIINGIDHNQQYLQVQAATSVDTLSICNTSYFDLRVKVVNNGPHFATAGLENMDVYMPLGYTIDLDSFKAIYNSPYPDMVFDFEEAGKRVYRISLVNGALNQGDSAIFSLGIIPSGAICGKVPLRVDMKNTFEVSCEGDMCDAFVTSGSATDTLMVEAFKLDVVGACDVADYTKGPSNNSQSWSGRIMVRNNGPDIPAGTTVSVSLIDDANGNSLVDEAELAAQFLLALSPSRTLTNTLSRGDTLQFVLANVYFVPTRQMLASASSSQQCYCARQAYPLAIIAGGSDTVCSLQEGLYATTVGMSGYTWMPDGGSAGQPDNISNVKIAWERVGDDVLSVSYIDHLGNTVNGRRDFFVQSYTPLSLTQDADSICAGTTVDLRSYYTGADQLFFVYTDPRLSSPLPSSEVGAEGMYYVQTQGDNCPSNVDSIYIHIQPYLDRPYFRDTVLYAIQGDSYTLALVNTYGQEVSYAWTPANPQGSVPYYTFSSVEQSSEGMYRVEVSQFDKCSPDPAFVHLRVHNVEVVKEVSDENHNDFVHQGEVLTYGIRVVNRGVNTITSLSVEDMIPANTQYASGGTFTGDAVEFREVNIAPGSEASFTFKVRAIDYLAETGAAYIANLAHAYVDGARATSHCYTGYCVGDSTAIEVKLREVTCPNIMTPNGDGENDAFVVLGLNEYAGAELSVMNRWGSSVYHSKDYRNDWDGGSLAEGVYFYEIKMRDFDGHEDKITGYVHIIR